MRCFMFWAVALLTSCAGPPAPDAALCEDVIDRLCVARACPGLDEALDLRAEGDCRAVLLERTGCGAEDFAFSRPSRERVLACRLPLVRRGVSPDNAPNCQEVGEVLEECVDVVNFLAGRRP